MKKISKNYRFPDVVLSALESRDRVQYPTETDYVATAILKLGNQDKEGEVLRRCMEIEKKVDLILEAQGKSKALDNHDFITKF